MSVLPSRVAFSKSRPWLQHAWDSSSLSTYMRCPRRYFLSLICGYRPHGESVDLRFGTIIHTAMEAYHLERQTRGHNEAQIIGLIALLQAAWEGHYYWQSASNNKNLWNAQRAFIWHTEQFGYESDFNTALIGKKLTAIELPFSFSLDIGSYDGIEVVYCGHMDRMVDTASGRWVVDYKTTKKTLGSDYFDTYQPSTQLPGYAVAAKIVFHEPVQGAIVDAFQIGVDFTRCARGHILLGEERANEWLEGTQSWITEAIAVASTAPVEETATLAQFAARNGKYWRMNTESCFICPFKEVCRSTPAVRGAILEADFKVEYWDPLDRNKA